MKIWYSILLILIFGLLLSFQSSKHVDKAEDAKKEIDRWINLFILEKDAECKKMAIERAEAIVDSVIHQENGIPKIDTMLVPQRPIRPLNDKIIELDTTEEVKPLFKKQH